MMPLMKTKRCFVDEAGNDKSVLPLFYPLLS